MQVYRFPFFTSMKSIFIIYPRHYYGSFNFVNKSGWEYQWRFSCTCHHEQKIAWCKMSDRLNEHQLYFPHFLSNGAINTALIQINQAKHLINILWSFSLKCPFSLHSFLACYHWKPRTNLELLWYFLTSIWNRLGLRPWLKLKQIINRKAITKCAAVT